MTTVSTAAPLLEVAGVCKDFRSRGSLWGGKGSLRVLDGVTFDMHRGETLAVVGESGSGKSTLGRAILQLDPPSAGNVRFEGTEITGLDETRLRPFRKRMQMIFQDPFGSLNPRMTVRSILAEPFEIHGRMTSRASLEAEVLRLLDAVRLPATAADRYPRQFSGGQRQRISIARAIALRPDFVVADEPVSALDVSIQAQILKLLQELQAEFKLSYLFIAHDLAVVRHIADRVIVMYFGRVVEIAPCDALYDKPLHPYTTVLLDASPVPDPVAEAQRHRITLAGEIPSLSRPPSGCPFHTRCPRAEALCREQRPVLEERLPGHAVACHFPNT
jgi:oligopeptide/dipeptide ABC transporter ATP-binding protein